ncbi:hypothetical protein GCM10019998_10840 [Tetragenococcus solitarius]|uniref:Uncharacterized protein n=1 Tax=Tetragenococcus solitarius TaxID=71453 RepID=A0ABN3Y375_9ENTE
MRYNVVDIVIAFITCVFAKFSYKICLIFKTVEVSFNIVITTSILYLASCRANDSDTLNTVPANF